MEKAPGELPAEAEILSAGNTVLLGTSVISGTAKVLMCRTGQNTELGEIADTLLAKAPPTAFEQGTRHFGFLIMRMTILLVLFVLLVNAFFHRLWLESFLFAVAVLLPFTPAGVHLGFVAPPAFFFLVLIAMLIAYLLAVEWVKQLFFRHYAVE